MLRLHNFTNCGDGIAELIGAIKQNKLQERLVEFDLADLAKNLYPALRLLVVGFDARTIERRGGEYTVLGNNGIDRVGLLSNPIPDWAQIWLTYFGVKDAATAAARAKELGGQILVPVSPEVHDGTMAVVADPTGVLLVLQKWTQ